MGLLHEEIVPVKRSFSRIKSDRPRAPRLLSAIRASRPIRSARPANVHQALAPLSR